MATKAWKLCRFYCRRFCVVISQVPILAALRMEACLLKLAKSGRNCAILVKNSGPGTYLARCFYAACGRVKHQTETEQVFLELESNTKQPIQPKLITPA